MSGFNKFLQSGGGDLGGIQDGTDFVYASTLSAANLLPSLPCKTDASRIIQSTLLDIADTTGLQLALDSKIANPLTANLDAGQFEIFDLNNIKIDTAGLGTDIATVEYNGTGNVTIDLDNLAGGVQSSSIPSINNRLVLMDGVTGELIKQDTNISIISGTIFGPTGYAQTSGIFSVTGSTGVSFTTTSNDVSFTSAVDINMNKNITIDTVDPLNNLKYGYLSLDSITTGLRNIGIGESAGRDLQSGNDNICIGHNAMPVNVTGRDCIAIGPDSLLVYDGVENIAIGHNCMKAATTLGDFNVGIGLDCMLRLTGGSRNTAVGDETLNFITGGIGNSAFGFNTLKLMAGNASNCTAFGCQALEDSTSAEMSAFGSICLIDNTTGIRNSGFGYGCLSRTTIGDNNSSFGHQASLFNVSSDNISSFGSQTLFLATGGNNSAFGSNAGSAFTTGTGNNLFGHNAGSALTLSDSDNIIIGDNGVVGDNDTIRIGAFGKHTSCFIQGIHGVTPIDVITTQSVIIAEDGELGSVSVSLLPDPSSTGIISGGNMTINADDTKFDVSDGSGNIYDAITNIQTNVTWTGLTAQSTTYSGDVTYISINLSGVVTFLTTAPSNTQTRDQIFLGLLIHQNGININRISNEPVPIQNPVNSIRDFAMAVGFLNTGGNACSPSVLLTFNKAAGSQFKFGGEYAITPKDPHDKQFAAVDTNTADTFAYIYQDGSTTFGLSNIAPDDYDDGNGVGTPGTVPNNQWTAQRMYVFSSGLVAIQAGQFTYANKDAAFAAVNTEGFAVADVIAVNGMLISILVVQQGATDLNTIGDAEFFTVGKFGGASSGSASGGDVFGPAVSVINRLALFSDTTGKLLKESTGVEIDASNNMSGVTNLDMLGTFTIEEPGGGDSVGFISPSLAASYVMTLPAISSPSDERRTLVNFNDVLEWADTSVTPFPRGHLEGLKLAWNSTSQFSVSSGSCRDSGNLKNMTTGNTTLNMTTSGILGIQASFFPETSSTWYGVFALGDTSEVLADTFIMLPFGNIPVVTGYDVFRRIGSVRNNTGSNLYEWATAPDSISRDRLILWEEGEAILRLLTNGSATAWTNVDLDDLTSPFNGMAYINVNHTAEGTNEFASFRTAGGTGTDPAVNTSAHRCYAGSSTGSGSASTCFFIKMDATSNIEYANISSTKETDLWVLGFIDNLD